MTKTHLRLGAALLALAIATPALADDITGEIALLTWVSGSELGTLHKLEQAFAAKHAGITFREIVPSFTGDPRGGLRTVLLGGEPLDLIENTWPAFRDELANASLIRPIDDQWTSMGWDKALNASWKALGQTAGTTYGVQFTYGDRSGWYYLNKTLEKAGVTPPKTWDEFLASFPKFKAVNVIPVSLPAKVWAHAEWFETLLVRVGGTDAAAKLAKHEIPWTSDVVKQALGKWKDLIKAGGIAAPDVVLGLEWDNSTDQVLKSGTSAYVQIGMWVSQYSADQFGIKPGTDFNLVQFPALGLGHDDTSVVDSKEFLAGAKGKNPKATDAFLDFLTTAEASNILAKDGFLSPSANVDPSLYNPVIKSAAAAVSDAKYLQFVLGDLLPGDLVDEYRVQLQKFIQNPSDETIDAVTKTIEAKAATSY